MERQDIIKNLNEKINKLFPDGNLKGLTSCTRREHNSTGCTVIPPDVDSFNLVEPKTSFRLNTDQTNTAPFGAVYRELIPFDIIDKLLSSDTQFNLIFPLIVNEGLNTLSFVCGELSNRKIVTLKRPGSLDIKDYVRDCGDLSGLEIRIFVGRDNEHGALGPRK